MKTNPRVRVFGKDSRDGFTLVELIVVLVILAILAAFLIPSLSGYIDKAREKQIIVQTRQAVMAAQTVFDEVYASDLSVSKKQLNILKIPTHPTIEDQIHELAELSKYDDGCIKNIETDEKGRIKTLTWCPYGDEEDIAGNKKSYIECTYNAENKSEPYTFSAPKSESESESD